MQLFIFNHNLIHWKIQQKLQLRLNLLAYLLSLYIITLCRYHRLLQCDLSTFVLFFFFTFLFKVITLWAQRRIHIEHIQVDYMDRNIFYLSLWPMLSLNTCEGRDFNIIFSYKNWHHNKKSKLYIRLPYCYCEFAQSEPRKRLLFTFQYGIKRIVLVLQFICTIKQTLKYY